MRHFLPVRALAVRVATTALAALLIATTSRPHRHAPSMLTTDRRAIPVTPVAVAAEEEHLPARGRGAEGEAKRVHGPASGT